MVTIHDVARLAGVSIATVSHVLNKTKNVSPATEARVTAALAELHYVPTIAAKNLKTNSYKSIGVIAEEVAAFSTPPIIDAICGFLDQKGFTVNLCNLRTYSHEDYDTQLLESSLHILEASRACGVIYIGANSQNVAHIRSLIKLPVVFAYSSALRTDYSVDYDNFEAARQAAMHLISKGHTRMGIITGNLGQEFVHQRIMGFQSAMVDAELVLPPHFILSGDWNYDLAFEQTCKLLSYPDPPTAIFAMNDPMACGVIAAGRKCGRQVPEQLSVIGFDDRTCSAYSTPAITTLRIPFYDIGKLAATILLDLLDGKEVEHTSLLPCELILRDSVYPLSDKR